MEGVEHEGGRMKPEENVFFCCAKIVVLLENTGRKHLETVNETQTKT